MHKITNILSKYKVDFALLALLGLLSVAMGELKILIPGIEGGYSDFREIPLIISVLHFQHPIFALLIGFLSSLITPHGGHFISNSMMHVVALFITWYMYRYMEQKIKSLYFLVPLSILYVFFYYAILLFPTLIISNHLFGINLDKEFFPFLIEMLNGTKFEIISTSLIVSLYCIQLRYRKQLQKHMSDLESIVNDRTKALAKSNHELHKTNNALLEKNRIINSQNNELKSTMSELQNAQAQLVQSEKMASLGLLTAGIAHEMNNPLNFIMGGYLGLKKYLNSNSISDEKIDIILNSIKTGIDRAENIIRILNQFSEEKNVYNEDCDIHTIVENCLLVLNSTFKNKVVIEKKFYEKPIMVKGNIGKLHQLFINLLNNANDAIREDGKIIISTEIKEKKLFLRIIDSGIGIAEKNMAKITEPFFTTKHTGNGNGLGLFICYRIVKEHGGKLLFESKEEKGTTVTISLPLL